MEKSLSELVAELIAALAGAAGRPEDAAMLVAVTPVTVGFVRLAERFVAAQEKQANMLMFMAKAMEHYSGLVVGKVKAKKP